MVWGFSAVHQAYIREERRKVLPFLRIDMPPIWQEVALKQCLSTARLSYLSCPTRYLDTWSMVVQPRGLAGCKGTSSINDTEESKYLCVRLVCNLNSKVQTLKRLNIQVFSIAKTALVSNTPLQALYTPGTLQAHCKPSSDPRCKA